MVQSVVVQLIGEQLFEVVQRTIAEQLALRFGEVPDVRKAGAALRTFRPDWSRRRDSNVRQAFRPRSEEENVPEEQNHRRFAPPKLVK